MNWSWKEVPSVLLMLFFLLTASPVDSTDKAAAPIWVLDLQGVIGPASSDLLIRSVEKAQDAKASLFLLRLDTPGGLDLAMREMIKAILASSIPVAVYVAPSGARAASAGTYILYSAHIAAMAPATNLGAATPVQIGGPASSSPDENKQDNALKKKQINDAVAYIIGLAKLRGRNAEWAEQAVREGKSLSAQEALAKNVIDLIATDTPDLIRQLEGKTISINDQKITLSLEPARFHQVKPDWRHQALTIITNPNVAYILLMIGVYGLILEFYSPGMGGPGIIGAICLLLGLYALHLLPISYAGLMLIFLGIALMAAEAFAPGFGVMGIGGIIAFLTGSIMLMDTELPAFQIALPVIAAITVSSALILSFMMHIVLKSQKHKVVSGQEGMIGSTATALEDFNQEGFVRVQGEVWHARSQAPVHKGDKLVIRAIEGLVLYVETPS